MKEPPSSYEENILQALVIANAKMDTDERLIFTKEFVPKINNWAVCDIFCGDWKVTSSEKNKLWDYCLELIKTGEEFPMRVSAVMMLGHFLEDDYIDIVLSILSSAYHEGYYFKMGSAWTLSYCFIKYPDKTEPFLFLPSLDKEIRNKAVQKICDSYRVDKETKTKLKEKKAHINS